MEQAKGSIPDLTVLDLNLPKTPGIEIVEAAHSDDVDQSNRFDADQIGAKRRKALSV